MSKQVVFAGSPQGCKGEGWATQFAFRGAGEICPDHYNSRSPELGYLLYFCAELGTDPRVVQSPDEWPLQSPAIRLVLLPGAAGTEGTTATSPWRNPGRVGGGGCTLKGKAGLDFTCLGGDRDARHVHCFPLMHFQGICWCFSPYAEGEKEVGRCQPRERRMGSNAASCVRDNLTQQQGHKHTLFNQMLAAEIY